MGSCLLQVLTDNLADGCRDQSVKARVALYDLTPEKMLVWLSCVIYGKTPACSINGALCGDVEGFHNGWPTYLVSVKHTLVCA